MRLLFDENLSPRLVALIADAFADCESVLEMGLGGAADEKIWDYAAANGITLVSKDLDFAERAILASSVKVVWVRLGNCTTDAVHLLLRNNFDLLTEFDASSDMLLELP